ncbi:MAG: hypothetical protein ACREDH_03815 [Methylocella sp.]
MAAAVEPRDDFSAGEPRQLAAGSKDDNQVRRLLALAAVRDGKTRAEGPAASAVWIARRRANGCTLAMGVDRRD